MNLAALLADAELSRWIVAGALIAARLVPVFTLAPFFGGRLLPATARVGLALAFAALLLPSVGAPVLASTTPPAGAALVGLLVKEVAIGSILGFLVALPFYAADAAGRLADMGRGASMSEVLVPQTGGRTTPLGDLSLQLAIVLFLFLDGHLLFFRALAASYEAVSIVGAPGAAGWGSVAQIAIASTGAMVAAAVGLAAPVLAATFLTDLGLGLLNRVSPQIQVYFVGLPVKAVLGVLAFMLALAAMMDVLGADLLGGVRSLDGAARGLAR